MFIALTSLVLGCGGSSSGESGRSAPTFVLSGTIAGLDEGYVQVSNGLELLQLNVNPNGLALDEGFEFKTRLPAGSAYDVRIGGDPLTQFALQCEVLNGQGSMPAGDVSNVVVRCGHVKSVRLLAGQLSSQGSLDGVGIYARFGTPAGIAIDAVGNLYVADTPSQTIRRISRAGVISTLAGSAGVSGATDGIGATALFHSPTRIAVDSAGNSYVGDEGNHTIRRITPGGWSARSPAARGKRGQRMAWERMRGFPFREE